MAKMTIAEFKNISKIDYGRRLAVPLPRCDKELAVLSEWFWGIPLPLKSLSLYGNSASYECSVPHDHYSARDGQLSKALGNGGSYEGNAIFWRTVIGSMRCGGIGGYAYGSVDINKGHRNQKRLQYWVQQRQGRKPDHLRPVFARLAAHCREQREQSYSR